MTTHYRFSFSCDAEDEARSPDCLGSTEPHQAKIPSESWECAREDGWLRKGFNHYCPECRKRMAAMKRRDTKP